MKILLINSVCGIKSTGRIVTDIAEEYISQGHTCKIAYGREQIPEKYRDITYRIGNDFNVKINALKARIFDNEGFNAKRETKKFIDWANEYNPDLLWLHNLHGYYINLSLLFEWIKTRPQMEVKWTLHDCWAFTGHCSYFSYVKCAKWITRCEMCPQLKEYPKSLWKDNSRRNYIKKERLFKNVNNLQIITPSKWLRDLVKQSFLNGYNVEVKYNSINTQIFKPTKSSFRTKYNLEDKKIILGVAAVWNRRKGLDDFVQLSCLLDEQYQIVLVGITEKEIGLINNKIICIPRTNNAKELAEIYTVADVFLNLTYEDNYPTVNLEAQACGTPCVTYCTGGSIESVKQEHIVEQGDFEKLQQVIKCVVWS